MKVYDEDGNELELPRIWEICDECRGEGKSSAYLGAITQSDREEDWDEESWGGYMRGDYDKPCQCCGGTGKLKVIAYSQLTTEQKKLVDDHEADERMYRAERDMERRMGA